MPNLNVEVLTQEEQAAIEKELETLFGIDPMTPVPEAPVHPNAAMNSLFRNFSPQDYDGRGRPVIDYETYLTLVKAGERLDSPQYMLRMKGPTGIGLAPAAKFQKFWGAGYRPITAFELAEQQPGNTTVSKTVSRDEIIVFYCNEKYPGCPRFFDSASGRATHWAAFHEHKWGDRKNSRKKRGVTEEKDGTA